MKFVKGCTPWNKGKTGYTISTIGRKFSDDRRKKMSLVMMGHIPWNKGKRGVQMGWSKGKKFSEAYRKKLSESHLGKIQTIESREKRRLTMKKLGIIPPIMYGIDNPSWKGGITPLIRKIRNSYKNDIWRKKILKRDNWICQDCQQRGGDLVAHHIKPFKSILKENNIKTLKDAINCQGFWDINNGITLCDDCHKKTDTYGYEAMKQDFDIITTLTPVLT